VIPLAWKEIEQLELGALEGDGGVVSRILADSRLVGHGNKGCLPQGDTLRETPGVVAPGSGRPGGVVEEKLRSRDDGWGDRSGRVAFSGHVKCGHVVRGQ
jgi:hypothetical protein